ncbi:MAG TPA: hypothetical protein VMN38_10575 [Sphingomicrobium sp.]|nr:hypothetical protein [Sphingomicrobium sp.]
MKFLRYPATAIVGLALLLTLPAIIFPQMTHDSFWIDWVWADQFTNELARGNLYPRWMPQSHGGLGSPVFYYYPPLTFYATAVFGLSGFSTYASIIAVFFIGFAASGFAMYAWLRESAKAPLFGAMLFMAAPYHVLDFYGRGALAEFLAIALIPVMAIGLRRAARGQIVVAALAYAALILTHLPLALLISVFLVAPIAACISRANPLALLRIAIPLMLGLAISAIYLLPAIALDSFRDTAKLWQSVGLNPQSWSLFYWEQPGPPPGVKMIIAAIILTLLQPIAVLLFTAQRLWGLYAGLCCILAAAIVPGFWTLPLLETVQFPFRLLPVAEFAIATGIAHLALPRLLVVAAVLPMAGPTALFLSGKAVGVPIPAQQLAAVYPDVPENLPPGDRPYSWPSKWALELSRLHSGPRQIGEYTVDRVFYFPAWEVRCQGRPVATFPEPSFKLLNYRGIDCERRLVMTSAERVGALISLAGVFILLGLALLARMGGSPRRRRPQPAGGRG